MICSTIDFVKIHERWAYELVNLQRTRHSKIVLMESRLTSSTGANCVVNNCERKVLGFTLKYGLCGHFMSATLVLCL